ncbi:MAG: hypothetical protein K0Q55_3437 [Verrucomicrobia bacterium]|jgi:hypothetical protein|nr:hypothetical protein [Verrucomicrobiota bacterium]
MSAEQQNWDKLVKLARQAPKGAEPEMPLGFATRVVANWPKTAVAPSLEAIWERLSLRFLGVAFAILLVTAGFSYNVIAADQPDVVQMTDSALGVVFEP